MGFDAHGLLFAMKVRDEVGDFGRTATIGRQGMHVPAEVMQKLLQRNFSYSLGDYCEATLLEFFGSSEVHSFDNSSYEGASHIHDFNLAIPSRYEEKYDTIIDAGSLEHIYDVRTAVQNFSKMLRPGGRIIHMNPANNFCGHGFYQFSPEFYFSVYSREAGFDETEVFLAQISNLRQWFKVSKPSGGERAEIYSDFPSVNLVVAKRGHGSVSGHSIQQSDYVHHWSADKAMEPTQVHPRRWVSILRRSPSLARLSTRMYFAFQQSAVWQSLTVKRKLALNARNTWLTTVPARRD